MNKGILLFLFTCLSFFFFTASAQGDIKNPSQEDYVKWKRLLDSLVSVQGRIKPMPQTFEKLTVSGHMALGKESSMLPNNILNAGETLAVANTPYAYYGLNTGVTFKKTDGKDFTKYGIGIVAHSAIDGTNNSNWVGDGVHPVAWAGMHSQLDVYQGATGNVTNAANFHAVGSFYGNMTIDKWSGLLIDATTYEKTRVKDAYGIYISPITVATNNYAIYTARGNHYFGGDVQTPGKIYTTSETVTVADKVPKVVYTIKTGQGAGLLTIASSGGNAAYTAVCIVSSTNDGFYLQNIATGAFKSITRNGADIEITHDIGKTQAFTVTYLKLY